MLTDDYNIIFYISNITDTNSIDIKKIKNIEYKKENILEYLAFKTIIYEYLLKNNITHTYNYNYNINNNDIKRIQIQQFLKNIKTNSKKYYIIFLIVFFLKTSKILKSKIKLIGYGFGTCVQYIDILSNKNNFLIENFTKKEIINTFSKNIDNFRNISIKINIYNAHFDNIYNNLIEKFKLYLYTNH